LMFCFTKGFSASVNPPFTEPSETMSEQMSISSFSDVYLRYSVTVAENWLTWHNTALFEMNLLYHNDE
jgi:hypothetical protein